MKRIALSILLCLGLVLNAQQFENGVVLDSIPVANSSDETFALYLPKAFNPNELSPLLIIFSPSGSGKEGVQTFIKAAETYNYILVCSNNSKNGPFNRNFEVAQALFNYVFSNFNIHPKRFYLAGFSGGSRLATAIATGSNHVAGVIACGAGFASNPNYMPSTQDFYYAGICGDRDMNFKEMLDTSAFLNRLKFRNTLFTFDGGHRWPPNEQILMAFETLEIEAHKKGVLKKTDDQLKVAYTKNYGLAKAAISENKMLLGTERYTHIINTFGSFYGLDSLRSDLETLKKSKLYINDSKQRKKAFEKEDLLSEKLISEFMNTFDNTEKVNLKWWDRELEKLDKMVAQSNSETQKMLERVQFKLFATAYEIGTSESGMTSAQKDFRKTILLKMRNRLF